MSIHLNKNYAKYVSGVIDKIGKPKSEPKSEPKLKPGLKPKSTLKAGPGLRSKFDPEDRIKTDSKGSSKPIIKTDSKALEKTSSKSSSISKSSLQSQLLFLQKDVIKLKAIIKITRESLLLDDIIVTYLYIQPLIEFKAHHTELNQLGFYNNSLDSFQNQVKPLITKDEESRLDIYTLDMLNYNFKFGSKYDSYLEVINTLKEFPESRFRYDQRFYIEPIYPKPYLETQVAVEYFITKRTSVFKSWSFDLGEDVLEGQINFNLDLKVDIFGFTTRNMRLALFAVEIGPKNTWDHIIKQYILRQMNIHLLNIHSGIGLETRVKEFIRAVEVRNEYVIMGRVEIGHVRDKFELKDHKSYLETFYKFYKENHVVYLRKSRKEPRYDLYLEADDEIVRDDGPPDNGVVVSNEFFDSLRRLKGIY